MSSTPQAETDLLLAHGAWIRTLARRLVKDEHRAEDLVQETWLAAMRHRGRPVRALRPWLAGILAKLTRLDVRGRARREDRERAAVRESEVESAAATVEAAALGRDLADLVLGLDEPFRTTILLRFYEDLPPRTIARRMNVPVRTVHSRIARGLDRLRARLRRRDGARWIALAHPISFGVAWMNAKQVVAIAAALALTAAAIVWLRSSPLESTLAKPSDSAAAVELEKAPPSSSSLSAPSTPTTDARSDGTTGATRSAPADPTAPILRRIRGRVLDPQAAPLAGIEVQFLGANSGAPPHAVSGAGGVFELDVPASDGSVRATDPHLVHVCVGIVRLGREIEPLVVVAPGHDLAGRVVDPAGAPLAGAAVTLEPPDGFMQRFEAVLDSTLRFEAHSTTDAAGSFALAGAPSLAGSRVVARLDGFADGSVEASAGDDRSLVLVLARPLGQDRALEGSVVDEENRPVAGAHVSLGERSTVTDSAGTFRLEIGDAHDAVQLVAVCPGHLPGRLTAEKDPATGAPVWPRILVLHLAGPPLSLAGRVVDGAGQPRPRIRIWIEDPTRFGILGDSDVATIESIVGSDVNPGDDFWRWCETDADGRFSIGGLLARDYRLGMIDPHTVETVRVGPFAAGGRDLTLRFDRSPERRIAGRVLSSRGQPVPGARLSLMAHTFGGISTALDSGDRVSDAEGRYAFEGVCGNDLFVWVQGDDIVPEMFGVPASTGDQAFDVSVAVRCHFQIHLARDPAQADEFRVLDADGGELDLLEVAPGGVLTQKRAGLVEGRSAALGVVDRAWTLSLLKGGAEVRRLEIRLVPGRLNVIEL